MSLDGLRAWIGEVERKLGMRTRVFLVLATIAIGGAGAAVYLAIDTRENAVTESDVQALQEKLEARIRAVGVGAAATAPEPVPEAEGEPEAGAPEGKQPKPEAEGAQPEAEGGAGATQPEGGAGGGASGGSPRGADNGGSANKGGKANLGALLRQTREANEKAEREAEGQK
jgi:hypothetical protein